MNHGWPCAFSSRAFVRSHVTADSVEKLSKEYPPRAPSIRSPTPRKSAKPYDSIILRFVNIDAAKKPVDVCAEVPFALIGRVVADLPQTISDRPHRRGHVGLPGGLHVIEDAGVLNVLACVDDGARRRAYLRRALVIKKGGAVFLQVFPPRHGKGPFLKETLLIDQDEQNVVTGRWLLGSLRRER